jgi:nitrite reductase/ring-hydroxylating ferredoxin subunit
MNETDSNDTSAWITVCEADDVFEGMGRRFEVPGLPALAVFNVAGSFHVTDDTCTHGDASLADGWLEGDEIECPFHQGRFCVRTGAAKTLPAHEPIRVYHCKLENGKVLIEKNK